MPDLEDVQEETGGEAQVAEDAGSPNPWENWQEAGFDPAGTDPREVHNIYEWAQALNSDDRHGEAMERMLQDFGYLQEGESFQDFQRALDLIRGAGDESGDTVDEGYSGDQFDVDEFKERLREELKAEFQEEFDQRFQAQEVAADLSQQLSRLADKNKWDDDDKAHVWGQVQQRLQTGDFDPGKLKSLVSDTWSREEARIQKFAARMVSVADDTTPRTGQPAGGEAASVERPVPRTMADIRKATAEAIGAIEDA